jgi:hypothetical protein
MHALWHWLLYVLAWAAHDPATLSHERARAAGCVAVAYAALAVEAPAPAKVEPLPPLPPAAPCVQCTGTGRIYRSDGGWVRCPCGACPTGRCPKK